MGEIETVLHATALDPQARETGSPSDSEMKTMHKILTIYRLENVEHEVALPVAMTRGTMDMIRDGTRVKYDITMEGIATMRIIEIVTGQTTID